MNKFINKNTNKVFQVNAIILHGDEDEHDFEVTKRITDPEVIEYYCLSQMDSEHYMYDGFIEKIEADNPGYQFWDEDNCVEYEEI